MGWGGSEAGAGRTVDDEVLATVQVVVVVCEVV